MAKQGGLGDRFYVGGYDLSGDTQQVKTVGGGNSPIDVTGIDKSAYERIGGRRDGRIEFTSHFNPTNAHLALSPLPTTAVITSYLHGSTIGNPAGSQNSRQVNYDPTRPVDGSVTFDVQALSDGTGFEWGVMLTAGTRTDTVATNGASFDQTTVSTSFGWQAYLHVVGFTGTSVTVTIQDSADNGTFANLAGGAFAAANAIGAQRIAGASNATVRRYVRAITSGTFSSAAFAVVFVRNETAVTF